MKSFALSTAFIMRFTATRKWPIHVCFEAHLQIRFLCNFCQTFLVQFLLCSSWFIALFTFAVIGQFAYLILKLFESFLAIHIYFTIHLDYVLTVIEVDIPKQC